MARSAVLDVKVLVDAAQAAVGLNDVAGKFESFGKKLGNAVIGAVAIKGVSELAKTVVTSASTMQQAVGGTDKVFGSSASEIHKWASDTTDSIRLPAAAVEQYATLIKTQLAATGQPMATLVKSTKDLIQVGADLSAVTGQDLASSIQAVKSALAGEYDPIQNLGVAMSGASVQAKALAIAHGDTALAASDAVVMQARVAEIMEKSAFATGAAAEEADSFQGRVDSLKEQVSGLAVAIGGPLLDSLAGIVGGLTDGAGAASTLGTGLGTMLGVILSLPAPILAIGAGLVALIAVSAKWGTSVAAGVGKFVEAIGSATSSVGGLKSALAAIGPALAGGALILGAAAIIGAVAIAIGRVTEGAKKGEDALQGYRDAIVDANGASNQATADAFKLAVTTSDAFQGLIDDGFSASEAVSILTGTTENWHDVMGGSLGTIHNLNRDTMTMVDGFIDANGHAKTLAQAQLDGAKAMDEQGDSAAKLGPTIAEAEQAGADAAKKLEEATKKAAEQLKEAQKAASATAANTLLNGISFAAESAKRSVDILSGGIDQLTHKDTFEATNVQWIRTLNDLPAAFQEAKDKGQLYGDALVNWDAIQLQTGEGSRALYDALKAQGEQFPTIVSNAFEAAGGYKNLEGATAAAKTAASDARTNFVNLASSFVGGTENAQRLADKLGILDGTQISDKLFQVIAADEAARAVVAQIQATQIGAKNFDITAGADGVFQTADDAVSYVNAAGEAMPPVPIHATAAPAQAVTDDFTGQKLSTPESFISVRGNINPFQETITKLMSTKREITVDILGNVNPWQATITGVMSTKRDVTVDILGNSGPARSAIAAVENGSYSATVRIVAETSSFFSTFNSLPATKPVGAGAAPSLQTFGVSSTGATSEAPVSARNVSSGGITINVTGAVDPDSTARQISSILERRQRRSGGIVI